MKIKSMLSLLTLKKETKLDLVSVFNTKSSIAWFQILRPNIASNLIINGETVEEFVSVFANATDTFGNLDNKYDSFNNEFVAGRKRMLVQQEYLNVSNKDNKPVANI